ncbi:tail assembly protein [Streptococcus phage smHBZ8]|nr:tail assembly protein [Streptococcus phage smHBZ8]
MIIKLLDNTNTCIALIDSEATNGLTFKNDTYHEYLKTNAVTFDFTIPKLKDGKLVDGIELISDASRFEAMINGRYQKFYIYDYSETLTEIKISCNNLSLEVLSEVNAPWINTNSVPVDNYIWNLLTLKGVKNRININEIKDRRRTISFEDTGTKISRLQTVASQFDCEFELKTDKDNTLVINIYDSLKEGYRGTYREDILFTKEDFKDIEYATSKDEMYNRVFLSGVKKSTDPKSKEEKETPFDLTNQEQEWKNSDGVVEFYTRKGSNAVDAPIAKNKYALNTTGQDDWTSYVGTTEYQTEADLLAYAHRFLKQHAYPAITLTLTLAITDKTKTLKIGDRIRVDVSDMFSSGGIWSLTISELEKSITNPTTITVVVVNVVNRNKTITTTLLEKSKEIARNNAPYVLNVSTDSSLLLKENGSAVLTASATRNNQIVRGSYKWLLNGAEIGNLPTQMIKYTDFDSTANVECQLIVDDDIKARTYVSLAKVRDGQSSHFYIAYADDDTGAGFSLTDNTKRYLGTYSSADETQSRNPADYKWIALDSKKTLDKLQDLDLADETNKRRIQQITDAQSVAQQELQAKASLATVQNWIDAYNAYVKSDAESRRQSQRQLVDASNRVVAVQKDLKDTQARFNFLTDYISASDDGLIIAKNDGTASARFSNDKISMYSAGREVMYISQGMIHIANGMFTQTLQIGNFMEIEYRNDNSKNAVVYVGGA